MPSLSFLFWFLRKDILSYNVDFFASEDYP